MSNVHLHKKVLTFGYRLEVAGENCAGELSFELWSWSLSHTQHLFPDSTPPPLAHLYCGGGGERGAGKNTFRNCRRKNAAKMAKMVSAMMINIDGIDWKSGTIERFRSARERFSIFGVIFAFRKPFLRFFNLLLKYCPSFRTVHVQCTYAGFANAQSRAALFCFFATFLCEICATKLGLPRMKERKREVCMVSNSSVLVVLLYGTHVSSFLQGKKVILRIVQKWGRFKEDTYKNQHDNSPI